MPTEQHPVIYGSPASQETSLPLPGNNAQKALRREYKLMFPVQGESHGKEEQNW